MQNTGKRLPGPSSEVTCENPASFIEAQTTSNAYCRCMSNYSPMPAFFIVELFPLKTVNKRLDLCGISRISIWIFLHRRRRRLYAARRREARAGGPFLLFSRAVSASTHLSRAGSPNAHVKQIQRGSG